MGRHSLGRDDPTNEAALGSGLETTPAGDPEASASEGDAGEGSLSSGADGVNDASAVQDASTLDESGGKDATEAAVGRTGRRKHPVLRGMAITLSVLLVLAVAATGTLAFLANRAIKAMHTFGDPFEGMTDRPTHANVAEDSREPINFLLIGSDSRISAGDPTQWEAGAQRTDALMIVQLSADRRSINAMSIPRDAWVEIPGYGEGKINAAFSYGGPTLTIQTVEQLTGIRIDHIAIVDFTSFVSLTDIVGGVDLTTTTEGTKHYSGREALAFVRERKSLAAGDFDRVRRQQLWMKAVLSKVLRREVLTSPSNLKNMVETMSKHVAVDNSLGLGRIMSIARSISDPGSITFRMMTAPYTGTARSEDGQSIVVLDPERFEGLCKAFRSDTVGEYLRINKNAVETLDSRAVR